MILTGSLYLTSVAISIIIMVKPPSPTIATTCRPGKAVAAATAYGTPLPIVASRPEAVNSIFSRIWR